MVNRFTSIFRFVGKKWAIALILLVITFSNVFAQCNIVGPISFTPVDSTFCGFPASIDFQANATVDSTPVFLSTAASSPFFQSYFSHDFPTQNNGCYYFLEISGMFTIWQNTSSYFDGFGNFDVNTNQFWSQGIISNFSFTPPLFLSPNSYNPNHVYQYYYLGDGSTINVNFSDPNEYPDNDGSMTFDWYAVPCFEYLWDFGDNTTSNEINPTHVYINPGTYQVSLTVTDLYNNCSESFNTIVTVNPLPTVDLGEDANLCNNQTLTLDATTTNASYEWQDGSTDPTLDVNQSGVYWVDVTVEECTSRDSVEITVLSDIVNDISATICSGDTVFVGNNNYTSTGFYTENLTSSMGCDSIVNLDLTVIVVEAIINAPLALDCNNSSISLDGIGSTIGPNISYSWITLGGNILNGENTPSPEIDGAGIYQLIVTYDDGTMICAATDTVSVIENMEPPIANAGIDQTLNCWNNMLALDGNNSSVGNEFSYQWTTTDGNIVSGSTTLTPQIDLQGFYTLIVTNETNGCTASDEVFIEEVTISISDFNILFQSPSCFGDNGSIEIQTIGNGPYLYSIDGGLNYYPDPVFEFLNSGDYLVAIKDSFDCEVVQNVYLPVPEDLSIQLAPEATIQYGDSYQFQAEVNIPNDSIASINWEPAESLSCDQCLDPVASPVESTDYTLTVIDHAGCSAQVQATITVKKSRHVFIPNAFSPLNRDGNNDVFKIYTSTEQVNQILSFKVFNRWGELIYDVNSVQANDPAIGWDGTFRGKMMQTGVYVYYIEIEYIDGKVINYKGDVSIIN